MNDNFDNAEILLVEDDAVSRKLVGYHLKKHGYKVYPVENGQAAMDFLEDKIPNLIICDIMMPVMDGMELRRRLLNHPDLRLVPFIFLSAKADLEDKIEGWMLVVGDYMTKPVEPVELIARVKSVMARHSLYEEMINYDHLTGLMSRRNLESKVSYELARIKRFGREFSVVMLDIDHFKKLNDTHGHAFGDEVLKEVAATLKNSIREVDFVGRMGGEEFVIAMPETDKATGIIIAERVRKSVSELVFQEDVRVTISGGVATAPEDGLALAELLKVADDALYRAKNNGRNRIIAADSKAEE